MYATMNYTQWVQYLWNLKIKPIKFSTLVTQWRKVVMEKLWCVRPWSWKHEVFKKFPVSTLKLYSWINGVQTTLSSQYFWRKNLTSNGLACFWRSWLQQKLWIFFLYMCYLSKHDVYYSHCFTIHLSIVHIISCKYVYAVGGNMLKDHFHQIFWKCVQ